MMSILQFFTPSTKTALYLGVKIQKYHAAAGEKASSESPTLIAMLFIVGESCIRLYSVERNQALRAELHAYGTEMSDLAWREYQLAFLTQHCYWTLAAHTLRDQQKALNIAALRAQLAEL